MALSTNAMLLLDQRTLQIKYRIPATEIYRLSLSPYHDNIAVFHVKDVSFISNLALSTTENDWENCVEIDFIWSFSRKWVERKGILSFKRHTSSKS